MTMMDLRLMAEQLKDLQARKESLEDTLKECNNEIERLTKGRIPEMMEALQLKNATFDGLGRVQLATDIYATTRAEKKEAAMEWLRDCGYEDMISETYNASSLKALFRRMLRDGTPIPDDIFNVTPFTRASIVKA